MKPVFGISLTFWPDGEKRALSRMNIYWLHIPRRLWNPVCRRPDEMEFGCEQRFQLGFPTADVGEEGVEGGAEVSKLRVVFVVEHLSLHEPPEALDHVEVWGVAWQVNRLDPAGFATEPLLDLARDVVFGISREMLYLALSITTEMGL